MLPPTHRHSATPTTLQLPLNYPPTTPQLPSNYPSTALNHPSTTPQLPLILPLPKTLDPGICDSVELICCFQCLRPHVSINTNHTTSHFTTLHYTTLHYTTLHYTTLHYTTLHYTSPSTSPSNIGPSLGPRPRTQHWTPGLLDSTHGIQYDLLFALFQCLA